MWTIPPNLRFFSRPQQVYNFIFVCVFLQEKKYRIYAGFAYDTNMSTNANFSVLLI